MRATTIGAVAELYDGPHATPTRTDSGPYFLNISSLNAGRLDLEQSDHVSDEDFEKWTRRVTPRPDDLLFSYETRLGEAALMPEGVQACLGRRMALLRFDRTQVDPRYFLYYYLGPEFRKLIEKHTIHGATVNRIPLKVMPQWEIRLPKLEQQRATADVLGALDDKIAANRKLIEKLRAIAQAEFSMSLATGIRPVKLAEVAVFHNRRRAPLSAIEREAMIGAVPYYGATGVFDYVDRSLFDEILLLVGEDGSVVTEDGHPVTQYIWGPAWVNNHAHVLTGESISTELLTLAVERADVVSLVTGAVQPKVSMGNLKKLGLLLPYQEECKLLNSKIQPIFGLLRSLTEESRTLTDTRDGLLPRLMSGELRVRDAEKSLEHVL